MNKILSGGTGESHPPHHICSHTHGTRVKSTWFWAGPGQLPAAQPWVLTTVRLAFLTGKVGLRILTSQDSGEAQRR